MLKDQRFTSADFLLLFVLAVGSIIGINQYTYGMYNHYITIPFIKSVIDPSLYPHDFLLAEKKYFYTYFNSLFGLLSKFLHVSLPVLFFTFYCISLYASLYAFFRIAMTLFGKKEVAYFSVIFLIFSFNTLGEIRTVESLFLERTFVLPILFFSIDSFLRKKIVQSYALAGIAFLFHPLSAVYVLACFFLCSIFNLREIKWKRLVASLFLLGIIVSPVLYLKVINPAPSLNLFNPDQEWLNLLRLRSAHHIFPSVWNPVIFIQAALFIVGFVFTWKYQPEAWHHRVVIFFCLGVLLMCLTGTIFTELLPLSIIVQFQLFRGFVFLIYFALIYYANFFFEESEGRKNIGLKLFVFVMFIFIFCDLDVEGMKRIMKFGSFLVIALMIFPGYALMKNNWPQIKKFYFPLILISVLTLGVAGYVARGGMTIQSSQEKNWLDVQYWARENTPKNAAFIVAPVWEGFRVEGERTIYGDWKDGTQMFFNPEFGKEWMRRMKMLGFSGDDNKLLETYEALDENSFEKIVAEMKPFYSKIFVVMPADSRKLNFKGVFNNKRFKVYEVN